MSKNLPPNLAELGHKRLAGPPEPDMETLRLMRSPLWQLENEFPYQLTPTSGYRDGSEGVGARISEHHFGLAADFGYVSFKKLTWLIEGLRDHNDFWWFPLTRVGLYPHRKFVHIGIAPEEWIKHYNKAHWWHENKDGQIIVHKTLDEAISAAREEL
jgi:hypothetical protein